VTDADVVLGIISADNFLGGRMKLDAEAARRAIREQIAEPLGLSVEEAAAGIVRIVNGHMADTLRELTIGRGFDPRDFVIFAYGGAGPAHCAGFGAELGVRRILVPATSMAHSAYGALASDIHHSNERSQLMHGGGNGRHPWEGIDVDLVAEIFADLEARCLAGMERTGIPRERASIVRTVYMRYRRQTHDLIVNFPDGPVDAAAVRRAVERFESDYEALYGRGAGFRDAGIELSTFRMQATVHTAAPAPRWRGAERTPTPGKRSIFEPTLGTRIDIAVWQWAELPVGQRIDGPAVIEHPETTVYVGPRQTALVDGAGNLSIENAEAV
jgi:N-methylhydantoinase A